MYYIWGFENFARQQMLPCFHEHYLSDAIFITTYSGNLARQPLRERSM